LAAALEASDVARVNCCLGDGAPPVACMAACTACLAPAGSSVRPLTLRQLKEFIEDIYHSKQKFDYKCNEAHLPRETMEQHLYTFLNQKVATGGGAHIHRQVEALLSCWKEGCGACA